MVKEPKKPQGNSNTSQNNPNQNLKLDSKLSKKEYKPTPKKTRQQINQENYQKNKEKVKTQQKERYQQQKQQTEKQEKEQLSKYSQASAYRVLMSLKEYTELNQEKRKIWLNFMWTFKDLKEMGTPNNIIEIMKLREEAENLINDYWETAKNETKKGKSWNSLDQEQKDRLIKYWGYEKARKDQQLLSELEQQEIDGKAHEKEIELAKFHEERGKIKCPCYSCENKREIQKEVKVKIDKELKGLEEQEADSEKSECNQCGKIRVLDEENGLCKKCSESYED